jgi:protein-S-isoprenylcysteine O-methyltransferase Ste14
VIGALRSLAKRHRFEVVRFGLVEAVTLLEPLVLAIATYALLVNRESASAVSGPEATAAAAGALLALAGLALVVWTLSSWRELFVGHAVLDGQQLVTGGAYGLVRHPVYLGALLIWGGLSLCFLSAPAAAITAIYVTPAYLLYIRSEEKMMLQYFGDQYRRYRQEVPMLMPFPRPPRP